MTLNPLIINKDYFGGVQARGDFIKAGDIDKQFTTISSYINKFIVPTLNQLVSSQIPGSNNPVDANKNLINVGDGTTKWDFPKAEYIPDYSLPLAKLVQANVGSILATDNNQIFRVVSPTAGSLALTARVQNTPIWKKIVGNDSISNRVITSEKIAIEGLRSENFGVSLARSYIRTIIRNQLIASNTIPSSKIAPQAITSYQMTQYMANRFCGLNGVAVSLWGNTLPDNFINDPSYINHWGSGIAPIDHTKINSTFKIPANLYCQTLGHLAFTTDNLAYGVITSKNIKERSLDGLRLFAGYSHDRITSRPIGQLLENGCIGIEQLPTRYRGILGL